MTAGHGVGGLELVELDNGVPVVLRHRPGSPVTTVSTWLLTGSRHELVPGVTHLAEHVLLQAVPPGRQASAMDEVESAGGEVNAITSKEHLVLYARVPTPDASAALAVLADSLVNREFTEDVVTSELRVVEEELRLAASDPNDIVHDVFFATAFPDHPIGRPVGGTPHSLDNVTASDLADWAGTAVHAGSVAVVVSGDLDAATAVSAAAALGALPRVAPAVVTPVPAASGGRRHLPLNGDSAAVILGGNGFPYRDGRLAVADVLMELLAGANTSTILDEIRNRRGLSYDVWGMATGYRDTGVWRIGIATAPEYRAEVAELASTLLADRVTEGFDARQVATAARRVAGLLRLEVESSLEEVLALGRHKLVGGDLDWTTERQLDALAEVSVQDVLASAEVMFADPVVVSAGGPEDTGSGADAPGTDEPGDEVRSRADGVVPVGDRS